MDAGRPTIGGDLYDLANYNSAVMANAYAAYRPPPATGSDTLPYSGNTNIQITMVNGNNTLSTVTSISIDSMLFQFKSNR
jgi:hypothetical protein